MTFIRSWAKSKQFDNTSFCFNTYNVTLYLKKNDFHSFAKICRICSPFINTFYQFLVGFVVPSLYVSMLCLCTSIVVLLFVHVVYVGLFHFVTKALAVAEKIHLFHFTQLLCYGLLQTTLKRIVDTTDHIRNLLCSYFYRQKLSLWFQFVYILIFFFKKAIISTLSSYEALGNLDLCYPLFLFI